MKHRMPDYSIYGGTLRSDLAFQSLPPGSGEPTWIFTRAAAEPPADCIESLGDDDVGATLRVRSFRREAGIRLEYDDTGTFDIEANGTRISWYPDADASAEAVCLDVLGRVVPMAMHLAGSLCLHGSAVELGAGVVGFLAPSGYGKSTLAMALVGAGARLVTDDVIAIDPGPVPRVRPGVSHVRLRVDSARYLGEDDGGAVGAGGKLVIVPEAADLVSRSLPLAALYLLESALPVAGIPPVRRTLMIGVSAAVALLPEARVARLLGRAEAVTILDRAAGLVGTVPVFRLRLARDFAALRSVAGSILGWHGGAPALADQVQVRENPRP